MIIEKALTNAYRTLDRAGVESARSDARLLMRFALNISMSELLLQGDRELNSDEQQKFEALVERRAAREPMAQVLGKREFWGLEFEVTKDTLDPRPDSETIIEMLFAHKPNRAQPLKMLDLGTGTGCLLLAALSEYPSSTGLGVDVSEAALAVARRNAIATGLENRAKFEKSDWNAGINGVWDVVISNPPYIPTEEIPHLSPEVAKYEPRLALDGGSDGLECYRVIIRSLPGLLAMGGVALFEVGEGQAKDVAELGSAQGLKIAQVAMDLAGIERVIVFHK